MKGNGEAVKYFQTKLGSSEKRRRKRRSRIGILASLCAPVPSQEEREVFKISAITQRLVGSGLPRVCLLSGGFLGRSLSNDECASTTSAVTVKGIVLSSYTADVTLREPDFDIFFVSGVGEG